MHIILIRHCTRIDKSKQDVSPGQSNTSLNIKYGSNINDKNDTNDNDNDMSDSSNWLSNFDPPLNEKIASKEIANAFKKISNDVLNNNKVTKFMIHSSPYNRCIQTSELLLDKITNYNKENKKESKIVTKLRVDQALSEWLNENYNLKYLPPNDDGYSMINNVNAYLNQPAFDDNNNCNNNDNNSNNHILNEKTKNQLRNVKDFTWSYNKLGHCGDYGESASEFTRRCFKYLINLLQYYYTKQTSEVDREMVVFIISHGAVISTLLQILLGRPVFNEIPLCTPIYFKQSTKRRSVFKLMDYDFNLNKLLTTSTDKEFYKILDKPIDLTKLDADNLRSELTIGTTGYTTIIQSIPKVNESPKIDQKRNSNNNDNNSGEKSKSRRRRNTINIGDKDKDLDEDNQIESLKHTRSSRQLYLLNKDTSDEKVIDLDKLHSYFSGGDSGSETDSEDNSDDGIDNFNNDDKYGYFINKSNSNNISDDEKENYNSLTNNVFKGSITSLSSFNEENKSKFQLNMKNFFSKPLPIKSDPFSHFFLQKNSTTDDDMSEFDDFGMSRKNSVYTDDNNNENNKNKEHDNNNNKNNNNDDDDNQLTAKEEDKNSETDDTDEDENILTFGTRDKIHKFIISNEEDNDNDIDSYDHNNSNNIYGNKSTVFSGTFHQMPIGNSNSKLNLMKMHSHGNNHNDFNSNYEKDKNNRSANDISKTNIKRNSSSKIQLISTRNINLHVRGGDDDEEEEGEEEEANDLNDKVIGLRNNQHLGNKNNSNYGDESSDESDGGWFGGFSK